MARDDKALDLRGALVCGVSSPTMLNLNKNVQSSKIFESLDSQL